MNRSGLPPADAFRQVRDGLFGRRIVCRMWRDDDAGPLYGAIDASREHLRPWMDWVDRHQNVGDTQDYITRCLLDFTRRETITIGIFSRHDNQTVLGGTGFHNIDWTVPALEIGYWSAVAAQGHGFISEAVELLTDFAFSGLSANRVSIHCDPRNERSRRVAERCSYELEGRLRNAARTPAGDLRDTLIFSRVPG